MFATIIVRVA